MNRRAGGSRKRIFISALAFFALFFGAACSPKAEKRSYLLAERLWSEGNYSAAVKEFEKVVARDPKGALGIQALYRAALTQTIFLSQHLEAARKLEAYILIAGETESSWSAEKELGEIWFSKLGLYDRAISHYSELLRKNPKTPDAAFFRYRIAKSKLLQGEFQEAATALQTIGKDFPGTEWAERSSYEAGLAYFTGGESDRNPAVFQQAIKAYEQFLASFPKSRWVPDAHYGIAASWEELDQIDRAIEGFRAILDTYPAKKALLVKIARLEERKANRIRGR